jgi:hypothetical protein
MWGDPIEEDDYDPNEEFYDPIKVAILADKRDKGQTVESSRAHD